MFLFVGMLFIRLVGRAKEKSRQFDSKGKISLNRIKIGWGIGGAVVHSWVLELFSGLHTYVS